MYLYIVLKRIRLYIALTVFLCHATLLWSQDNYTISYLTKEERANFGDIYSLYEDPSGIIWMGVYGKGLSYYDGERIKRFILPNEENFASRDAVFEGFEKYIYLNYGKSIHVFDPIHQDISKVISLTKQQTQLGTLSAISVTRQGENVYTWGALRLNTQTPNPEYHLLISKNHGAFRQLTTTPIVTKGNIFIKRIKNTVYAKTETGFDIWDAQAKKASISLPEVPMEVVTSFNFKVDEYHTVWVGGDCELSKGSDYYQCNIWKKTLDSNQFTATQGLSAIRNVMFSLKSYLRKLTIVNGKYFPPIQQNLNENVNAPINIIQVEKIPLTLPHITLKSKSGIIWWGNIDGLYKLTPHPPVFKLLPALSKRSFVEDKEGYVYGSKGSSIMRYNPNSGQVTTHFQKSDSGNAFWYHINSYKGNFYAFSGILDLDKGYTNVLEDVYNDFSSKPYLSLITQKGELWKAHWGIPYIGIYNSNTGKRLKKIQIEALQSTSVNLNDWYQRPSDKTIWLGTFGIGIFVFDEAGNLLYHLNRKSDSKVPLVNNVVSAFYEDKQGNMWIGHGSGLSRIDAQFSTIKHFTFDLDNPESRLIYGILPEDNDQFLWLSTSKGIFRFNSQTGLFMDFPLHPNVMKYEYNRTSYYKSKKGQFFFGADGVNNPTVSFYPKDVLNYYTNISSKKAEIILTSFSQYNDENQEVISIKKGLQSLNEIILQPGDRFFELSFLLSDFRSTENNNYTYYLENYEDNWRPISRNNNNVRYENLSPGRYKLKLRGGLAIQSVSQNERIITVIVKPYWYQTIWAKIILGFLTLGIAFIAFRFKLKQERTKEKTIRLQELDNLKTKLYTNITHEFRTPLTVIMGMNESISGHPHERSLIQRNAENLLGLINQLLELSKLDSGKVTLNIINDDIIVYLQYLTESFYSMASQKKVSLQFESQINNLEMDYDEIKIQNIIYNLLSNAIKFTKTGGKISVQIHTFFEKNSSNLSIEVKDTGEGISAEDLPYIFERFYQAEHKTTINQGVQSYSGTGIGLSLTKELVEVMGGSISVKSEQSWGTSFRIILPIKNNKTTKGTSLVSSENKVDLNMEDPKLIPDEILSDKPLLLVIEDNLGIVSYIKSIVKDSYYLQVATDGQEAIDKALAIIPDLIISDVMMPEKNGFEVCDILKKDERTSHIPIIMLTAKADMSSKIEGLETGADAYMTKPFEKNELLTRIKKLLELRKKLQAYYGDGEINVIDFPKHQSMEHLFVTKIHSYIEENFQDPQLSVTTISEALNLNHSQLYRKLKAVTGKTLSQFVRSVRLQKAISLIQTTDLTIAEIAYEVGFNDPNYFTRAFKKEFNKVPGDLRSV